MQEHPISNPLDRIRGMSDDQRRGFLCWLSGRLGGQFDEWLDHWLERWDDPPAPAEHDVKFILTAGGVYSLHCSCGQYDATAPTQRAAIVAAAEHRAGAR